LTRLSLETQIKDHFGKVIWECLKVMGIDLNSNAYCP